MLKYRWLSVWFVLSLILVLVGLWRLRVFTGEDGVVPFRDEYLPPRLDLSGADGDYRIDSAPGSVAAGPGITGSGVTDSGATGSGATGSGAAGSVAAERADGVMVATNYQEALRNRQLGRLEERWKGEEVAEGWTIETTRWLDDEFEKRGIPGRLEQPDCRKSLCKLRIVFDDPSDAGKIYAVNLDPRTNWYTDFRVVGGQMVVTAYLGAPGENLRQIINDPFAR
jgi:hypothetical protein